MPKTLGTYFNELAKKAGLPSDNKALKDFLSTAELATINIPDELTDKMDEGLHNIDSAAANPKVRTKVTGETFSALNARIDKIVNDYNLDDAFKVQLLAEGNSYNRIELVTAKIKELESQKAGASKGEKSELQKEINDLKAAQSKMQKDSSDQLADEKAKSQAEIEEMRLETILSRYNYALGNIDPELKIITASAAVKKALAEGGAKFITDPINPKSLKLVANDGTDYYDKGNNKKDIKSFIEGAIAPILSTITQGEPADNTKTIHVGDTGMRQNTSAMQQLQAEMAQLNADVDA